VDIWSAGVVTYVLLTGEPPFDGDSLDQIYKATLENDLDLENSAIHDLLSNEAKDFISKVLTKNSNERITATECLNHPWLAERKVSTPG